MMRAVIAAFAMTAGAAVSPAAAQAPKPQTPSPNLAGLWTFQADLQPVCDFNGQARLIPTDNPAKYDCELTAEQVCPAADVRFTVEQSCKVAVDGDIVTVSSTIQRFLEGEPTENYLPDNFTLAIRDESHLEGILVGDYSYPAEWRRAEGAIS